jgi:NADH-quinone oxidoreductase subunit J
LILFAIMLTRNVTGTEGPREVFGMKWWTGGVVAAALAFCVLRAIQQDPVSAALSSTRANSSVLEIGKALVANWVVPFEAMAVLLTAALIGAVVIALEEVMRRR